MNVDKNVKKRIALTPFQSTGQAQARRHREEYIWEEKQRIKKIITG
ncbi:MAG: hypothetical protein KAI81_09975 [Candidatus Marinimicrobia bacterium]|nr:hypothetical protein [Candidatus Neomarinimicrobiota bacterium]